MMAYRKGRNVQQLLNGCAGWEKIGIFLEMQRLNGMISTKNRLRKMDSLMCEYVKI
jgi:hypothetical protein